MKTVLVVEDTDDLRELFAIVLEREGYNVVSAENGQAALEAIGVMPQPPNLVLLDVMMPVMDGSEFMASVQRTRQLPNVPVVVISARAGTSIPGTKKHVLKPIAPDALVQLVRECCGSPD